MRGFSPKLLPRTGLSGAGKRLSAWTRRAPLVSMAGMEKPAEPPAAHPRRFDSPEQEAFLNLWRTDDRLHVLEEELFGRYDLTPQQYNALRLLRGEGGRKLATLDLASRLVSRAPDITRLLDKLEERGLVERERPAG